MVRRLVRGLRARRPRDRCRSPRDGHAGNGRRLTGERDAEDVLEVRRRIGADQEHPPAAIRERHGRRPGKRGLAHAALAGKEEVAGRPGRAASVFMASLLPPQQPEPGERVRTRSRSARGSLVRRRSPRARAAPRAPLESGGFRPRLTTLHRRRAPAAMATATESRPKRVHHGWRTHEGLRIARKLENRSTGTPWPSVHWRSALNRANAGSGSGPQTPVEQHSRIEDLQLMGGHRRYLAIGLEVVQRSAQSRSGRRRRRPGLDREPVACPVADRAHREHHRHFDQHADHRRQRRARAGPDSVIASPPPARRSCSRRSARPAPPRRAAPGGASSARR